MVQDFSHQQYHYSIPFRCSPNNSLLANPIYHQINLERRYLPVHLHSLHPNRHPSPYPHNLRRKLRGRTTGSRSNCAKRCEGRSLAETAAPPPETKSPSVASRLGGDPHPSSTCWIKHWKRMAFDYLLL